MGRVCNRCEKFLPWEDFSINKKGLNDRKSICKVCSNKSQKLLYKTRQSEDPEAFSLKSRHQMLYKNYGLLPEDYDRMHSEQKGLCKICERPERSKDWLYVDHCHNTGEVRGLLCGTCNSGIGQLCDSIEVLERAIAYLKKYK